MEYASNGKGNLGVTLGAIGTGLGALGNNGLLSGLFGGGCNNNYVTKDVLDLQIQLGDCKRDNAILSADLASEKKMVEVFNAANDKIMNVRDELTKYIRDVDKKVDDNAASQGVINATYGSQINLNTSQINQLYTLTKLTIPNSSVNPGWGNVCIVPTGCGTMCSCGTTGTTTTA